MSNLISALTTERSPNFVDNESRGQIPPPRDVKAAILKKTRSLRSDGMPPPHPPAVLLTGSADHTSDLADGSVGLVAR